VAGKLFSRLLVALTLLGLSLPVLALVRLLGGVELWQMVGAVCVCAVTALFAAALGLLFSAFINRAYAVILLSYVTLLLVYGFVPFVLIEGFGLRTMVTLRFFAAINPFFCSGMIAEPRMFVYAGAMWTVCVTLHLGATAGLVMLAAAVLRRVSRREGERSSVQTPETQPDAPAAGRSGFVRGAIRARRWRLGAGRGVWDQPVLWREARRSLLGKPWHSLVAGAATVGLLAVTYATLGAEGDLGDRWTQQFFACVFNGLFWLLAAVLSATSIAQEKESDTWTLLLTTPLGGHAVVWGKVAGLCRRAAWPLLLFAAHFVMFWVSGILPLRSAAVALWVIVTFNSIWVATGMYLSLRLRKVTLAVIVNLMLAVVAYLGMLAVLVIVGELGYFDDLYKFVSYYVPYYYLTAGLFDGWPDWQNGVLVMPGDVRVTQPQFDLILAAVGVAHLVVAALVLWWTAATFDDIVGRAPRGAVGRTSRPAPKTGPYFSAPANL
jgi:hypothetical protein